MKFFFGSLFLQPLILYAVQKEPSLPAPYTFEFKNTYAYQYIPSIDQAINPMDFYSHNNFYFCSLSGSFKEGQAMFFEVGANSTSLSSFNFLQTTFEYRFALLNELTGDPLSVQIAPIISFTPAYRIKDVNTAYQNILNVSALVSLGKEFDNKGDWVAKIFGAIQSGISSKSGPFIDIEVETLAKLEQMYMFKFSLQELVGFAKKRVVNVSDFGGWSEIEHQSLQVKGSFSLIFSVYGNLELLYAYRLYSKSYYQNDSTFALTYSYPFSP